MATIAGNLWEYNFARIIVLDVTDDYRLSQGPVPMDCYPVLKEVWVPMFEIDARLADPHLMEGYLYDWHESPDRPDAPWFVGVVHAQLLLEAEARASSSP